jgi:hypothetical protein
VPRLLRRRLAGAALGALCLALPACGARYVRVPVYDSEGIRVELRAEKRDGKLVPRSFSHPATISAIRVAHVLARLDVRMGSEDGGERVPAFPTVTLYKVGEEVSRAFAKADPHQEVVVKAVRVEKRLGLFHSKYLTSFVAWMKGDDLVIHLSRVEWLVPKDSEDEIPEPYVDRVVQEFKVLPAEGVVPVGEQAVSVDWRNPVFREASHVRVGPGGKLMRRTVLIDSEAPAEGELEKEPTVLPADLPAETLRALADLQERRTRGEISETTYHKARRDLLRQVEDARQAPPPEAAPAP